MFFLPLALAAQETSQQQPTTPPSAIVQSISRSTVAIDAKARSEDILKAYDLLKREKPTLKISARTYSGQILSNVVDITAMPNGTLLLFRTSSAQGIKNQFISVDDVIELFYS